MSIIFYVEFNFFLQLITITFAVSCTNTQDVVDPSGAYVTTICLVGQADASAVANTNCATVGGNGALYDSGTSGSFQEAALFAFGRSIFGTGGTLNVAPRSTSSTGCTSVNGGNPWNINDAFSCSQACWYFCQYDKSKHT